MLEKKSSPGFVPASTQMSITTVDGETQIVVDGKTYRSIEEIPDPSLREIAAKFWKK